MRPTIKDVAKKAQVSTATVSLVMGGHPRISPQTIRKVKKTIKELGYVPSKSARDLVSRKTGNIGFVLTDDHFLRTEPFYTQIFLGTEFAVRQLPYYILLATIPSNFSEGDALPRFVVERNIDGLIIAGKVRSLFLERLKSYNFPVVMIDFLATQIGHSSVLIDNQDGAFQATNYLISLGHKDIAFLGAEFEHPSIKERYQGYKNALEQNKLAFNEGLLVLIDAIISKESGYKAAKEVHLKKIPFSGIIACNDAMAIGAMQYFKDVGVNIPEELSIVGFDDIDSDIYQNPPLSTISVPKIDMGQEAIQLIVQIIEKKIKSHKKIIVPVELVVRGSTKKH